MYKRQVLVPEISLTPQMIYRLKAFFGDRVAVQHSAPVSYTHLAAPAAAPAAPAVAGSTGAVTVTAPMPGNILDGKAAVGASVKAGDVLCIREAMKMENEIVAPQDGTVASVNCRKGDVVNVGDLLVSLN